MIDESKLAYLDTETTGLHPTRHHIWEVAVITAGAVPGKWDEDVFLIDITDEAIADADPIALEIGRFHERHPSGNTTYLGGPGGHFGPAERIMPVVARLTHGKHLVGACPWFDAQRLETLMHRHGIVPGWHYHLIDSEALAYGFLMGRMSGRRTMGDGYADDRQALAENVGLPWKSSDLSKMLGIDPDQFERHTALGDARWAKAMYEAVTGVRS